MKKYFIIILNLFVIITATTCYKSISVTAPKNNLENTDTESIKANGGEKQFKFKGTRNILKF